jgi:ATP-dependent DNA helicase 2 subunit 1
MLAPPPPSDSKKAETDSPTTAAIKCAYQIMQQRIISNPKDMMGVLLFGTEKSKFQDEDMNSYPNCYLLTDHRSRYPISQRRQDPEGHCGGRG